MKIPLLASVVMVSSLFAAGQAPAAQAQARHSKDAAKHADAASALKHDMRKLWTDHVVWTRDYIIAAVGDQADATAAANRLMRNQEDIGDAVAKFYGAAAGQQLTTPLEAAHLDRRGSHQGGEGRRQSRSAGSRRQVATDHDRLVDYDAAVSVARVAVSPPVS